MNKRAIISKGIKWLIGGIILILIGYSINEFLHSQEVDVDIKLESKIKDGYIPIHIINTGGKKLTDVYVYVKSCDMNHNKTQMVPDLPPDSSDHIIEFKDDKTLEKFGKLDCSLETINKTSHGFWMELVRDRRNGQVFPLPIKEPVWGCSYCYWDIIVKTNEITKTFRETTFSPSQLTVEFGREGSYPDEKYLESAGKIFFSIYDYDTWNRIKEIGYDNLAN